MCPMPPNPEESLIYTIKNITREGSSIPHAVRPPFESRWAEQKPDSRENPTSREISPTRKYPLVLTQKDLET